MNMLVKHMRPRRETLRRTFKFLEDMGLRVYGPAVSTKGGKIQEELGCMDYSLEDVLTIHTIMERAAKSWKRGEEKKK